jgi:hypothetical protein
MDFGVEGIVQEFLEPDILPILAEDCNASFTVLLLIKLLDDLIEKDGCVVHNDLIG